MTDQNKRDDPHWKQDFSVDWDETSFVTRREFTRFLGLGSVGLAAGSTYMAVRASLPAKEASAPSLALTPVDAIKPRGFLAFEYPRKGDHALLLRHKDGSFSAYSQRCPHLGCSVFYAARRDRLECPCHEGFFDPRSGDVTAGPPQRGLEVIALEIRDGVVYATGGGEA